MSAGWVDTIAIKMPCAQIHTLTTLVHARMATVEMGSTVQVSRNSLFILIIVQNM